MCGVYFSSALEVNNSSILELQRHRGPDATVGKCIGKYFIGHNRLAILDLDGGEQPVDEEGARYVMSYNGEVYNYIELSSKYLGENNPAGDTSVIYRLINKLGVDIVREFTGMFAIILLDKKDDKLLLIRDHFGIKPLYYTVCGDYCAASSEPKVLYQWRRELGEDLVFNEHKLIEYFHYRTTIGVDTFVKGICRVEPSSVLEIDMNNEQQCSSSYYKPKVVGINFSDDFEDIVKMHLRSDVSYGVFLSGGIDSTLVASFMNPGSQSFTVRSKAEALDETPYAKIVADKKGLDMNVLNVDLNSIRSLLEDFSFFNDDPVSDPSAIGLFAICKKVRERNIKVVLAGEGADELFYGYGAHLRYMLLSKIRSFLPSLLFDRLMRIVDSKDRTFFDYRRFQKFMGSAHITNMREKLAILTDKELVDNFYKGFLVSKIIVSEELKIDRINRLSYDILMRSDRASMASGVEIRTPFLTQDVEAFADNLNMRDKIRISRRVGKFYLKERVKKMFGHDFAYRKKMGFDMSVESWIDDLKDDIEFFKTQKRIKGINYSELSQAGIRTNKALIWAWLTLEFWYEEHILRD